MDPKDRKQMILDVAEALFYDQGYEGTSTQEIIKKSKIARGTLYYYFDKKEDILDAVIDRKGKKVFARAQALAKDKDLPARDRLIACLLALHQDSKSGQEELDQVHAPQNALMHQKIQAYILDHAGPLLSQIVEDGVQEGDFSSPYPKEAVNMILIYANEGFDHGKDPSSQEDLEKFEAFFYHIHLLLGAQKPILNFKEILD